jgi:ribosomal protein S18 acetylase RimI-like enzyme
MNQKDIPAILTLICADHLPGQPVCTVQDVQNTLTGHATIDLGWWEALTEIRTIVALDGEDVVGCASYSTRKHDDSQFADCGFILWLHAHENREASNALLSFMLADLANCPRIYAFWIATPLTLGVEALPVYHRPVMHDVLLTQGFTGTDDWLYMRGPVLTEQPLLDRPADVEYVKNGWKLLIREGNEKIAEAEIGLGKDKIGVLWWIEVNENWRGYGLGKQLLLQARKTLGDAGARHVILYVDHDDLAQRNRMPAIHLYQSQGFTEIDHLWSYWNPQRALM